jgi:excisionase family DNA binding protein
MDNNTPPSETTALHEREDNRTRQALLLRLPDAAALLGIGRTTLYNLIDQGQLGVVHIGRTVRVPIAEVHAFVARQRRTRVVR